MPHLLPFDAAPKSWLRAAARAACGFESLLHHDGWSAATLYRLTGDGACARLAHRAATGIAGLQQSDGSWDLPVSPILACDCTGEMA
jgi:hypothetical protein